jgi:hypothetical protein
LLAMPRPQAQSKKQLRRGRDRFHPVPRSRTQATTVLWSLARAATPSTCRASKSGWPVAGSSSDAPCAAGPGSLQAAARTTVTTAAQARRPLHQLQMQQQADEWVSCRAGVVQVHEMLHARASVLALLRRFSPPPVLAPLLLGATSGRPAAVCRSPAQPWKRLGHPHTRHRSARRPARCSRPLPATAAQPGAAVGQRAGLRFGVVGASRWAAAEAVLAVEVVGWQQQHGARACLTHLCLAS